MDFVHNVSLLQEHDIMMIWQAQRSKKNLAKQSTTSKIGILGSGFSTYEMHNPFLMKSKRLKRTNMDEDAAQEGTRVKDQGRA